MLNFNGVQVSLQQMQRQGFHVCPIPLRPGSVIEPGNWGRVVHLHGVNHNQFGREQSLELLRVAEFPDKPSRYTSAFYCPTAQDADWFRRNHAFNNLVYLVVPLDPDAPTHLGYMNCLPPIAGQTEVETARHYWAADLAVQGPDMFPARELVTASPLLVIENLGTLEQFAQAPVA